VYYAIILLSSQKEFSHTRRILIYWVVKDADDPNSNGFPYSYLLAPVNGVPEHGNPNPDY